MACTLCDSPAARATRAGLRDAPPADWLAVGLPLLLLLGCAAVVRFAPLPRPEPPCDPTPDRC